MIRLYLVIVLFYSPFVENVETIVLVSNINFSGNWEKKNKYGSGQESLVIDC